MFRPSSWRRIIFLCEVRDQQVLILKKVILGYVYFYGKIRFLHIFTALRVHLSKKIVGRMKKPSLQKFEL